MPDDDDNPLAWQSDSLCAQTSPEAFFPERGGSTLAAKRICASCDVRQQCLEYALANDERFGIWGGLSERERRRVKNGTYVKSAPPVPALPRHGTNARYGKGCRDEAVCPPNAAGRSCVQAHRDYQNRWLAARRRAGGAA